MSFSTVGAIQVKDEKEIVDVVADVKNDATETNYILVGYVPGSSNQVELVAKGAGGLSELLTHLTPDFMGYGLLRVISGDAESKRPKFIFISYAGESISLVKKGKMGTHVSSINQMFGYSHVSIQASNNDDLEETHLMEIVKKASGADYDSGSNKDGYVSKVAEIKAEGTKAFSS